MSSAYVVLGVGTLRSDWFIQCRPKLETRGFGFISDHYMMQTGTFYVSVLELLVVTNPDVTAEEVELSWKGKKIMYFIDSICSCLLYTSPSPRD